MTDPADCDDPRLSDEPRSWLIVVDFLGRPILSNARQHHMVKAREMREWRAAGRFLAREQKIPRLGCARFDVWGRFPTRNLPDDDNIAPSYKAVRDGLVDAGVLADDGAPFVAGTHYHPSIVVRKLPPALCVVVTEVTVRLTHPSKAWTR